MDRALAEKLADELRRFSEPINRMTEISLQMDSKTDAKTLRHHLAAIMSEIDDIWRLMARRFPDLGPASSEG